MMIGHLPAGYLALRAVPFRLSRPVFIAGLIGSVAPDLDMLWFLFVDHGAQHHHHYLTHRPALWAAGLLLCLSLGRALPPLWRQMGMALTSCALLHLALDNIVGEIAWGWPLTDATHPLVVVPATQSHWVLSFLVHWTFAVEIALLGLAAFIAWRDARA